MGTKNTGGMSAYLLGLSSALAAEGHQVDLFTRSNRRVEAVHTLGRRVRLFELNDRLGPLAKEEIYPERAKITAALLSLFRRRNLRYSVIFSHYWLSGLAGAEAAAVLNLPHLIMFHTLGRAKMESCPAEQEPAQRLTAEETLAQQSSLVAVASLSEKERLLNYYNLPAEKVILLPAGFNRHLFRPCDRRTARCKLRWPAREKVILAVGRLEPLKGYDLLIQALARLSLPDQWRLVIVGGDGAEARRLSALRNLAADCRIKKRVSFTGPVPHRLLPLYYSAADLTAITSTYESFGLVALESLACGTPLVAGSVGVIPELAAACPETAAVTVVNQREPAAWADAISNYFQNRPAGQGQYEDLLAPYSWPYSAGKLDGHLTRLP